jgi:mRNA deadenylase 3'-5' endonuclease subunit Ccr4
MRTYEKYPSWGKNHLHKLYFLHNYKTNPGKQMLLEDYREGSTMATCRITLRTQKLLKTTFYISKLQQLLLNKEQRIHSFLTVKVAC